MGILEHHPLFLRVLHAALDFVRPFFGLEIYSVSQIFLMLKDMADGVGRPFARAVGIIAARTPRAAVFNRAGSGDILFRQLAGDLRGAVTGKTQVINLTHDRGGFLVNEKLVALADIPVNGIACNGLAAHSLGAEYGFDFLACILNKPLVK